MCHRAQLWIKIWITQDPLKRSFVLLYVLCVTGVPIRLAGTTQLSGRVEIYYNNIWGTVCDNGWDLNDANVVCRELGYGTALTASHLARSGEGPGQVWLENMTCSGSESSLTMCRHGVFGRNTCGNRKDAGVVCSGEKYFWSHFSFFIVQEQFNPNCFANHGFLLLRWSSVDHPFKIKLT